MTATLLKHVAVKIHKAPIVCSGICSGISGMTNLLAEFTLPCVGVYI